MPGKRGGRTRAAQPHVQVIQSDYDTDAANMTDTMAATAPIPPKTNEELNLSVLKRHDASIIDILAVANFAVVYVFSNTSQQWEKCGIEGTLFVCQQAPEQLPGGGATTLLDRYNVMIINRKGLDNYSTPLTSSENIQITDEYVIIQVEGEDGISQCYGLWIFADPPPSPTAERKRKVAEKIFECAVNAETSRRMAEEEAASAVANDHVQQQQQQAPYDQSTSNNDAAYAEAAYPAVGRQVSMNELFGQQAPPQQQYQVQEQQSQYNHPPQQHYQQQPDPALFFAQQQMAHQHFNGQQPYPGPPPGYNHIAAQQQQQHQLQQQQQQQQQRDVIGDLFRNAKHGYSG